MPLKPVNFNDILGAIFVGPKCVDIPVPAVEKVFKEKRRNASCLKCGFLMFSIRTASKKNDLLIYLYISIIYIYIYKFIIHIYILTYTYIYNIQQVS